MAENALTKVARIAAGSAMGATYKDKDGKQQVIKPTGDANYLDLSGVITNSGSSSDGGGTNPDNPSAGADYYAGSLADGEITERNIEWSGTDDPTKSITINFKDDPGAKPFGQYDGLMIIGYIQKTVMTKGVVGAVSNIYLDYDPDNKEKDGYFVTTSPYPIAIHASDLIVGQKNRIPINGIGENLSGKNTKAPVLYLTYTTDRTAVIEHESGYDNDGDSAGATGANYQFIVQYITTFSRQNAVAQLPAAVNYFNGDATGDIALVGNSKYFEDSMDGIEITFDNYAYYTNPYNGANGAFSGYPGCRVRVNLTGLGLNKIRIPKEYLISGTSFDYSSKLKLFIPITPIPVDIKPQNSSNYSSAKTILGYTLYISKLSGSVVKITSSSLNVNLGFYIRLGNDADETVPAIANVIKVTPYKN